MDETQSLEPFSVNCPPAPTAVDASVVELGLAGGQTTKLPTLDDEVKYGPPHLSYWEVFKLFLGFGLHAWGGPVAQIAMLKDRLVTEQKWISGAKFIKVYGVYQMLPGPEAMELCCYFGYVARGRIGAFLGGFGFLLPGFILMLLASWIYTLYGTDDATFQASFLALQPAMSATIFRAVHKISEHAIIDQKTKRFSELLFGIAMFGALTVVLRINLFISLPLMGLFQTLGKRNLWWALHLSLAVCIAAYVVYCHFQGVPSGQGMAVSGEGLNRSEGGLFLTGLMGGLMSFGGAYTAIPVVQQSTVSQGWITNKQFLDGLALGTIMPAPTVIFSTFVGFIGGRWVGAILMTIGMFLPAFSFTIIGHQFFEYVVDIEWVTEALDGISAGVVGFIAVLAFQFLKASMHDNVSPALFALSLAFLYGFKHRLLTLVLVVGIAIAGQAIYNL